MNRIVLAVASGAAIGASLGSPAAVHAGVPLYTIVDIGLVSDDDTAAQALGISPNGIATGRSSGDVDQAFTWTLSGGIVGLPALRDPSRPFCLGNAANDAGEVVGTGATDFLGSNLLPIIWKGGVASQLPLPEGETFGRATAINGLGVAVGSVESSGTEVGVLWDDDGVTVIRTLTPAGSFLQTALGINDAGMIVGQGVDPNNRAITVGYVLDTVTNSAFELPPLPGGNGTIAYGISNNNHVAGASSMNQSDVLPFVWTSGTGSVAIPLPAGTVTGQARAVNSSGIVVGAASMQFSVPFIYDGTTTYALADLLPGGSGWDLSMNSVSNALGISEDGIIVGTGMLNGEIRAFAMIPVETCEGDLNHDDEVGAADLGILLSSWGPCAGCPADFNDDGVVDGADLGTLVSLWGACVGRPD